MVIMRKGNSLIPSGSTILEEGDHVVISGPAYREKQGVQLVEKTIKKGDYWVDRPLAECSKNPGELVVLIRRGEETLIPRGDTYLKAGDVLVIHSIEEI